MGSWPKLVRCDRGTHNRGRIWFDSRCRCEVCDCDQDDGRRTVSEQGVQRVTSKSKKETALTQAEGPLRQTNTGAHEKLTRGHRVRKNLGKKERTTGAEDTQNQHYQRVRTVVDTRQEGCGDQTRRIGSTRTNRKSGTTVCHAQKDDVESHQGHVRFRQRIEGHDSQ